MALLNDAGIIILRAVLAAFLGEYLVETMLNIEGVEKVRWEGMLTGRL